MKDEGRERVGGTEGGRYIRTPPSPTHTLETDQCFHSYSNKVICMNGNTQIAR